MLGPLRADDEYQRALERLGLTTIATLDELSRLAEQPQTRDGFVAAVGAAARRRSFTA